MISIMIRDSHYNHFVFESARITGDDIHMLESYGFKVQGLYGSCCLGFGNDTLRSFLKKIQGEKIGMQGSLGF